MSREEVLYLVPYFISLLLSLGIFLYAWRHRHVRGARLYAIFVAGQTASIFAFILELISPNLDTKILWDKFQFITETLWVIIAFLIFAIQFTEYKIRHPATTWILLLAAPIVFTILLVTDGMHHLIYPDPHLNSARPFSELEYEFTYVVYLYALYLYTATFYGIGLLIRRIIQPHNFYRSQLATIAIGFLIPVVLSMFSLLGIRISAQRDVFPFSTAIGNLIVAIGLFRFRLFDLIPIAREHIIENIKDPIMVLDAKNRLVDMNQAALKLLGKTLSEVIGRPSSEVFARWPVIVSELEYLDVEQREISVREGGDTFFFDVNISSIYSNRHQLIGRIVVARDVTKYKTLESGYRLLSGELEQRVRERTEELRHSAERYRAVVENQTEFIVRWKPDGTRTFVNEAYCRYWGLTYDQALSSHVMSHLAKEDRHAVEEKISRLTSGAISSETEIHRVVRPDGSIGWQEWTDQAILDEFGQVVEFQSVGRDITERKLAEDSVRNQLAFDKLMTSLLTRFATCSYDEVDASIVAGLNEIAEFMGADSADILILSEDKTLWRISHQWRSSHLPSVLYPNQTIPVGKLPWSETKLLRGDPIKINTLDDYPPKAMLDRQFSEAEGVKSLVSVPIQGLEKLTYGCIDLLSYTRHITWSDKDVAHLKMIGDSIANLLERKRAEESLAEAYETTLEGWAKALELRDKETEGHSRRVTETTLVVARVMGFDDEELIHLRHGTILHDIGKMAIPDEILRKPGPLTDSERQVVMHHPKVAYDLLVRIPHLKKALEIPYLHHEKWDGTGYPRGLKQDEIPLSARIFAVVDVWDALSSDRPYRKAWPKEKVSQYINAASGKHFDPKVVTVFLQLLEQGKI
jgi:PAS domain S-box-containing protein